MAAFVVVDHSFKAATGEPGPLPYLGGFAVDGFFAISGFLIAGSRLRMGMRPFLWRRGLRLMPGYWGLLIFTALVVAPASTFLDGRSYDWGSGATYVLRNALLVTTQMAIDGTPVGVPYEGLWNASTWSLPYEAAAYVVFGLLVALPAFRARCGCGVWSYPHAQSSSSAPKWCPHGARADTLVVVLRSRHPAVVPARADSQRRDTWLAGRWSRRVRPSSRTSVLVGRGAGAACLPPALARREAARPHRRPQRHLLRRLLVRVPTPAGHGGGQGARSDRAVLVRGFLGDGDGAVRLGVMVACGAPVDAVAPADARDCRRIVQGLIQVGDPGPSADTGTASARQGAASRH